MNNYTNRLQREADGWGNGSTPLTQEGVITPQVSGTADKLMEQFQQIKKEEGEDIRKALDEAETHLTIPFEPEVALHWVRKAKASLSPLPSTTENKWDKLNKEFDAALDSMTPEKWKALEAKHNWKNKAAGIDKEEETVTREQLNIIANVERITEGFTDKESEAYNHGFIKCYKILKEGYGNVIVAAIKEENDNTVTEGNEFECHYEQVGRKRCDKQCGECKFRYDVPVESEKQSQKFTVVFNSKEEMDQWLRYEYNRKRMTLKTQSEPSTIPVVDYEKEAEEIWWMANNPLNVFKEKYEAHVRTSKMSSPSDQTEN